jgi:hypothetical protein
MRVRCDITIQPRTFMEQLPWGHTSGMSRRWLTGVAVVAVALGGISLWAARPNSPQAQSPSRLTGQQIAQATAWARSEMHNAPHIRFWSATADLHQGMVRDSNTGHNCESGTLLRVLLIGSFRASKGQTVVTTAVIEADPKALYQCEAYGRVGNFRPPQRATTVIALPGVRAMYRHIGRGPHGVPLGTP